MENLRDKIARYIDDNLPLYNFRACSDRDRCEWMWVNGDPGDPENWAIECQLCSNYPDPFWVVGTFVYLDEPTEEQVNERKEAEAKIRLFEQVNSILRYSSEGKLLTLKRLE